MVLSLITRFGQSNLRNNEKLGQYHMGFVLVYREQSLALPQRIHTLSRTAAPDNRPLVMSLPRQSRWLRFFTQPTKAASGLRRRGAPERAQTPRQSASSA